MTVTKYFLELAKSKGYLISENGDVIGKRGIRVLTANSHGYYNFTVRINGGRTSRVLVHKLQAYQKFGDKIFEKGIVVRHLNGNSKDNSYENIAIGTQQDNMLDRPELERKISSSNPIYNHGDILKDRNLGLTHLEICEKYGCSKSTVSFIINKSLKKQGIL